MKLVIAYVGILLVLIIALKARKIGIALGVMDDPGAESHKKHTIATPLVGVFMVGTLALTIIVNQYFLDLGARMVGVSTCTLLVGALGFFDDKHNLSWPIRLGVIALISCLLVWWVPELQLTELRWSFGTNTSLGGLLGFGFAVACVMTLIIAMNMMDGYNGAVIGLCLILFVIMAAVATSPHRQAICLFLASALGIMFIFNMKGEFFLGDGGAYALAILVGSLALTTYTLGQTHVPIYADTIAMWLCYPALDCLRVIILRKYRKKNPFVANRDHLHHLMGDKFGPKKTLIIVLTTTSVPSVLCILWPEATVPLLLGLVSLVFLAPFALVPPRKTNDL